MYVYTYVCVYICMCVCESIFNTHCRVFRWRNEDVLHIIKRKVYTITHTKITITKMKKTVWFGWQVNNGLKKLLRQRALVNTSKNFQLFYNILLLPVKKETILVDRSWVKTLPNSPDAEVKLDFNGSIYRLNRSTWNKLWVRCCQIQELQF